MLKSFFLKLPFIAPGQALRHITHNEALNTLDQILHLSIERQVNSLPTTADDGERILLTQGSHERDIAIFLNGQWTYHTPEIGWLCWDKNQSRLLAFTEAGWTPTESWDGTSPLGINTQADTGNRLAVASDASLFTHDGTGHSVKVNKAGPNETASLIFQENFTGHAEIGLAGNNDLTIKTSLDGAAWLDAVSVNSASGQIRCQSLQSGTIFIPDDQTAQIPTPSGGGIVLFTITDPNYARVSHSAIMAYDSGNSPQLLTLAATANVTNQGTTPLTGTTGPGFRSNISVSQGALTIENRASADHNYSYTFLC